MQTISLASLALILLSTGGPSPKKIAMLPFKAGDGVRKKTAASMGEAVVAELRRHGLDVITRQEMEAILNHEQQQELLGCSSERCLADIGGALGVDHLAAGNLAKLGKSWMLHLKLINVMAVKTVSQADKRIRDGTLDDVLDAIPRTVAALLKTRIATRTPPPTTAHNETAAPPGASSAKKTPPAGKDEPLKLAADVLAALQLATDGKGHYVAFNPKARTSGAFLHGTKERMYEQRVHGASRNGDKSFSFTFWEPRVQDGWRRSFGMRDGKFTLFCGDKRIQFEKIPEGEAKQVLAATAVFKHRWRRHAHAMARDNRGNYYYVDRANEPRGNNDFRLYVGTKGSLGYQPVNDAIVDDATDLFIATSGRLELSRDKLTSVWWVGDERHELKRLNLYQQGPDIYKSLGVYGDEKLATACDAHF